MKTKIQSDNFSFRLRKRTRLTIISILAVCTAFWAMPRTAHGQIIYETNQSQGTIGEYDGKTGAPINAALVSGIGEPFGIAVAGGHIWVALNGGGGPVGEYDATTGATINASAISVAAYSLTVSGGDLYVLSQAGSIGVYDAMTGAPINASLVTGLSGCPSFVAASGGNLYVTEGCYQSPGLVAVYDATTGALINPSLISFPPGPGGPGAIVVSGNNLWVSNGGSLMIGEYDATTGAPINASLITGVQATGMVLSGGNLFIAGGTGTISEYNATTGAVVNASLVSGLVSGNPFSIALVDTYSAQIQQPINSDGSSVFNVKRGVVPVKFTLSLNGVATCALPSATISVVRTAGGVVGPIDESTYLSPADSGSNFRIDSGNCQYVYNLAVSSLGAGTYKVNILIGGSVVGNAIFSLK